MCPSDIAVALHINVLYMHCRGLTHQCISVIWCVLHCHVALHISVLYWHDVSFSHCCSLTRQCTMTRSVCPAAASLCSLSYPSVYFTWCVLHCCNLNLLRPLQCFCVRSALDIYPRSQFSAGPDWPDKTFDRLRKPAKWLTVLSWYYISFVM